MILGRGSAQTDEEIIAEYRQALETKKPSIKIEYWHRMSVAPQSIGCLIQKPILQWTDEDILFAYRQRSKSTAYNYNAFLQFLFFRGYHHPGLPLLVTLPMDCSLMWGGPGRAVSPENRRCCEKPRLPH